MTIFNLSNFFHICEFACSLVIMPLFVVNASQFNNLRTFIGGMHGVLLLSAKQIITPIYWETIIFLSCNYRYMSNHHEQLGGEQSDVASNLIIPQFKIFLSGRDTHCTANNPVFFFFKMRTTRELNFSS